MYEPYNKEAASTKDRIAWALCQIIDDDAPLRWTQYRFAAGCIANNRELMSDLRELGKDASEDRKVVDRIIELEERYDPENDSYLDEGEQARLELLYELLGRNLYPSENNRVEDVREELFGE